MIINANLIIFHSSNTLKIFVWKEIKNLPELKSHVVTSLDDIEAKFSAFNLSLIFYLLFVQTRD